MVKLTKIALESNNFQEAERQANLALSIDSSDYDLLLMKARAIDNQTNGDKSRLLEVYNCYLAAFEVLSNAEKDKKKEELFEEVVASFKSEISFWVGLIEKQRPTRKNGNDACAALDNSVASIKDAGIRMNIDSSAAVKSIQNSFAASVSAMANSAWKSTVAYNYYRESLHDYGRHWKTSGQDVTDEFRPTDEVLKTFGEEVDLLTAIMSVAAELKNDEADLEVKATLYSNMAFFLEKKKNSVSFKRYSYSDNYGSYYEYWTLNRFYNDQTKAFFQKQIDNWRQLQKECEKLAAQEKARVAAEKKKKEEAETKARIDAYWVDHADEKAKLESEKAEIQAQLEKLNTEMSAIPEAKQKEKIQENIDQLTAQKSALGLFKGKEKKDLQKQIDSALSELATVTNALNTAQSAIQAKIDPIKARQDAINTELTKAR